MLLFTCARALHLELMDSMSLADTMLALRRFVARRGLPSIMYSDNSQSASPIQHTVDLVFGYKVFLKVYFNVKIHADFKSVCSQTQNVERFAKSMF